MMARRPVLDRPYIQNVLIVVALAISAFMMAPPISPVLSKTASFSILRRTHTTSVQQPNVDPLTAPFKAKARRKPVNAKGIIMTGYTAGGPRVDALLGLIDRTELNAVVIDVKDERGEV